MTDKCEVLSEEEARCYESKGGGAYRLYESHERLRTQLAEANEKLAAQVAKNTLLGASLHKAEDELAAAKDDLASLSIGHALGGALAQARAERDELKAENARLCSIGASLQFEHYRAQIDELKKQLAEAWQTAKEYREDYGIASNAGFDILQKNRELAKQLSARDATIAKLREVCKSARFKFAQLDSFDPGSQPTFAQQIEQLDAALAESAGEKP